jgi:peroxiredoxin
VAAVNVGDVAPDFELPAVTARKQGTFRLGALRGKSNVLLAFYPLDWSPTCTTEMTGFNTDLHRFTAVGTEVVGISVDSLYSHIAWQERGINGDATLASDFWPHGEIAKKYGVFRERDPLPGISDRAIFIVDKRGKIAFAKTYELGEVPDMEECLDVLKTLP